MENTRTITEYNRFIFILENIGETIKLNGCMAEIGIFWGGISRILATTRPDSPFYACDGFIGLPKPTKHDTSGFIEGDFKDVSYEKVEKFLSDRPNIKLIKGLFPDKQLHQEMFDKQFFFVHLDVDLYESTLLGLEFFYPRMVRGGVIVVDDSDLPGVKLAIKEFRVNKTVVLKNSGCGNAKLTFPTTFKNF